MRDCIPRKQQTSVPIANRRNTKKSRIVCGTRNETNAALNAETINKVSAGV